MKAAQRGHCKNPTHAAISWAHRTALPTQKSQSSESRWEKCGISTYHHQPLCRGVIQSCGWLKSLLPAGSHSQGITGPCRIKPCLAMLTPCLEWRSNGEWTRTGCPPQSNAMTERKRLTKTKRKNAQGKNRKRSQVGRHSCEQRAGTVRCATNLQ